MKDIDQCSISTHVQQLPGVFDPARVLRLASQPEMLLFESADVVTKLGEKSMLFMDLALKIEARAGRVIIHALMSEALPLLSMVKASFLDLVQESSDDTVTLAFEPLYYHLDLLKKMKAQSALDVLRAIMAVISLKDPVHKKNLMLCGSFAYDFLDHFEILPNAKADIHDFPDYLFYLPLTVVVIDHKAQQTECVAHGLDKNLAPKRLLQALSFIEASKALPAHTMDTRNKSNFSAAQFRVDVSDDDFGRLVSQCKEHISAGDVYQIVPSRTFSCGIKDPLLGYEALRQMNPSPYMFYVRTKDWTLLGASPETFIKVDKDGSRLSIRPIAGTRRRGFHADGSIDEELDSREQASLCLDEKELAEHMMLVDLARNDIASVSKPKSRRIKRMLVVDRFSHVMHLVSEVEGKLLKAFDALSAYQASMNMGTLMGAPKVRAAELLRSLERTKRGFYGGAVGYLDGLGNMDTAIIIRSALVHGETAYVRAGCGVVSDSNIQFEVEETLNKAEATLRALTRAGAT
jgi:anthranilate synthase component I